MYNPASLSTMGQSQWDRLQSLATSQDPGVRKRCLNSFEIICRRYVPKASSPIAHRS